MSTISCPSCGGPVEVAGPHILQATCEFCDSLFLLDAEGARLTGKQSRLLPSRAGFAVGLRGKWKGRSFVVRGRVQYGWSGGDESGSWDEWYLELEDGETVWFSEDMGTFRLEKRIEGKKLSRDKIRPGLSINLENTLYRIMETGEAVCEGARGQLPFVVDPQERYFFADGKDVGGEKTLTIEFDNETPTIFTGTPLSLKELEYEPVRSGGSQTPSKVEALKCQSCGSSLSLDAPGAENAATIVCASCGSIHNLDHGIALAVGRVDDTHKERFFLELGDTGELEGAEWAVTGRMVKRWEETYTEYDEDGTPETETESGITIDYLLYNNEEGYLWLTHEDGAGVGSVLESAREATILPEKTLEEAASAGSVRVGKESFRIDSKGNEETLYVDGALPWKTSVGEESRYFVAKRGARLLTEEHSGQEGRTEVEYYEGKNVPMKAFLRGFGYGEFLDPIQPPGIVRLLRKAMVALFFLVPVSLFLLGSSGDYSSGGTATEVLNQDFPAAALVGNEINTSTFSMDRADQSLGITLKSNIRNLDASPRELGIALQKESGEILDYSFTSLAKGSSSRDVKAWRVREPGNYSLRLSIDNTDGKALVDGDVELLVHRDVKQISTWWAFFLIGGGAVLAQLIFTGPRMRFGDLMALKEMARAKTGGSGKGGKS